MEQKYIIDNLKPGVISYISIKSSFGRIDLEWKASDDAKSFNIYRSTEPNPGYNDFYASTNQKKYLFYHQHL